MGNDLMRVAIYARVSTSDQNCEMQLSELSRYIESRGWAITEAYIDDGYSGATANRPALKRCLADALTRKWDVLMVWKLDRWGRTVAQLSADILALDSAGVRFICPSQGIDTDQNNPMSRLTINILSAFAQFERDVIIERVACGKARYVADFAAGRIGKDKHSRSGKDLAPHRPSRVFDRQKLLDLRAGGLSIRAISKQMGLPVMSVHNEIRRAIPAA